jgi:hypothetical protein
MMRRGVTRVSSSSWGGWGAPGEHSRCNRSGRCSRFNRIRLPTLFSHLRELPTRLPQLKSPQNAKKLATSASKSATPSHPGFD